MEENKKKGKEKRQRKKAKKSMLNRFRTVFIVLMPIFLIIILANISSAIIDCSLCHKTMEGKVAIKAKDTIEINDQTCLKCHNPDYPPVPIGYNTHLTHIGKYSAKVNYFARHPKIADSLSCDNCHMNIGQNCQTCHMKGLPHIPPPLGNNCKGCHGELDNLFRHPTINLKIHDLFNYANTTACAMCHNSDNMGSFKLASGGIVPIQESHGLCFQCHSYYYNLWNSGAHYAKKTLPNDSEITASHGEDADISTIRADLENTWRKENTCVICHNPHNPSELYQLPIKEPIPKPTGIGTMAIAYAIFLIIIIALVIIFIIKKKKLSELKLPRLKLSELKLSKLKKLKLPKISIPISISVEKPEKFEHISKIEEKKPEHVLEPVKETPVKAAEPVIEAEPVKETEPVKEAEPVKETEPVKEALERLIDETFPKTEIKKPAKKNVLYKYRKDIYFILAICIMLSSFYVIFGAFLPITVVVSESMSPHINRGDVIFYTNIDRINEIKIYANKTGYKSFENDGDVILYKPLGEKDTTPYIHRAMYFVEKGQEMWPGGPIASHEGYITKGDNIETNPKYDQQVSISYQEPIKKEWIVGVARFRVPYIGYIRLVLS